MRDSAQWFWVNWDMDQSFRQPEQDTFWSLVAHRQDLAPDGQATRDRASWSRCSTRILSTARYFQRVWTDVMNHVLTPAFLDERFEHYFAEASRLDVGDRAYLTPLKEFLERRPTVAWQIATDWLRTGPAVACRVGGTRGAVVVDGRRVAPGWQGSYFPGMRVALSVPQELVPAFSHWVVNGVEVKGTALTLDATSALDIEPIWVDGASLPQGP